MELVGFSLRHCMSIRHFGHFPMRTLLFHVFALDLFMHLFYVLGFSDIGYKYYL